MVSSTYAGVLASPQQTLTLVGGSGSFEFKITPQPVRDAGANQNIPVSDIRWFYTPDGLVLCDTNSVADYLNASPATENFNG